MGVYISVAVYLYQLCFSSGSLCRRRGLHRQSTDCTENRLNAVCSTPPTETTGGTRRLPVHSEQRRDFYKVLRNNSHPTSLSFSPPQSASYAHSLCIAQTDMYVRTRAIDHTILLASLRKASHLTYSNSALRFEICFCHSKKKRFKRSLHLLVSD